MKKVKFIFGVIIIGFIVLFIIQNQNVFMTNQSLKLNLWFIEELKTQEFPNAILLLSFFLIGFLISYFLSLSSRFKAKKTIKKLNAEIASRFEEVSALKDELEALQMDSTGNAVGGDEDVEIDEKEEHNSTKAHDAEG